MLLNVSYNPTYGEDEAMGQCNSHKETQQYNSTVSDYEPINIIGLRLNKDIHCQRTVYFTLKTHIMANAKFQCMILHNLNNVYVKPGNKNQMLFPYPYIEKMASILSKYCTLSVSQ